MRNLTDDVINKDDRAKVRKEKGGYFDSLVKGIRDCGENVSVWSSKGRGELDWEWNEKGDKQILPDKFMSVVHNDTHDDAVKLWKIFWKFYTFVCSDEVQRKTAGHADIFWKQIIFKTFLKPDLTERKWHSCTNATLYMHCLMYHVPYFIFHFGSLRKFSGQPAEKTKDNIKLVYHLKTNNITMTPPLMRPDLLILEDTK